MSDNGTRTPLVDANKKAVSNPYLTNRSKPQQQQQQQQAVVQAQTDENDNDNGIQQPNTASNTAAAMSSAPSSSLAPTATSSSSPLHQQQQSNDTVVAQPTIGNEQEDALGLLSSLQRDYEELQKTSVKSCLRSKHYPCPEVSEWLEEKSPNLPLLQEAFQTLLQHPDYLGKSDQQHHPETTKHSSSSLWCMTRLGTAIRFLQLLLVSSSSSKQIDPQATTPMILGLLQSLTTTLKERLLVWRNERQMIEMEEGDNDQNNDNEDKENDYLYSGAIVESYHAPQVMTFAVAFLLRTKTLFLNHRPDLLCALWKTVESLSESLAPPQQQQLSVELLQDAIQGLSGILKDFLQQLVGMLALHTINNPGGGHVEEGSSPPTMHPQQFKLASFFLARLGNFLKFAFDDDHDNAEGNLRRLEDTVLEEILSLLLCLRGLSTAAMARHTANKNTGIAQLLKPYRKLVTKAEKCVSSMLTRPITKQQHPSDDYLINVGPRCSNVKLLLGMKHTSVNAMTHNLPGDDESTLLLKDAFYLGKAESLVAQTLHQSLHHQQHHADDGEKVPGLWTEEANVNLVLAVCEHLLFDGLPMCHHLFASHALLQSTHTVEHSMLDQLLNNCLRCISDVLFQCETLAPCMKSNADRGIASLHRLLLRWLLPVNEDRLPTLHHPLTRECVVTVIQFHAIRLVGMSGGSQSTASCMSFVALLVKVFFDARTFTCHRATLSAVLRNLLASSAPKLSQGLQELISAEYGYKRPLKPDPKKRKRDRKGKDNGEDKHFQQNGWDAFSLQDMRIIGSVLTELPFSAIPNLAADIERFCLDVVPSDPGKGRPKKLTRNTAKVAILVLAFLEAVARQDPTDDRLKSMSGGKDLAEVQCSIISWFLALWNVEFANGKRKHTDGKSLERLASLGRALLHLVAYGSERVTTSEPVDSGCMTEQQMQHVFKLLQVCTGMIQMIPSRASVSSKPSPSSEALARSCISEASLMQLVWEASELLGTVVKAFPPSNADSVLQGLVEIYQKLLEADTCWSFQAHAIGSLHDFSKLLPKSHCHLLASCIRKRKFKALLQCRLQGTAYGYEKSSKKDGSKSKTKRVFMCMHSLLNHSSKDLETLVSSASSMPMQRSVLSNCNGLVSSAESISISLGSYFLTMPTQGGRKAIVIFPPEKSSLRDIGFMLGSGGDEEEECSPTGLPPGVQQLRHAVVSKGGSCKMILKPP